MSFSCFQCNKATVENEFERCPSCKLSHKELCAKLDAVPRKKVEKVREELFEIKSMRRGVEFTDIISRQDAMALGINLEGRTPMTQ